MNKKILTTVIVGIMAMAVVSAGLLTYYGYFQQEIEVKSPITVSSVTSDIIEDVWAGVGGVREGKSVTIENIAPIEVEVKISNNNGASNIDVSYVGTLELTKKNSAWEPLADKLELTYTVVGDTFEFSGVPTGYTLIYYKDAYYELGERLDNPQPAIVVTNAIGNLPQLDDANMNELADYCQAPDNYNQCKGAKLWIVSDGDLTGNTLNWAHMFDGYYYETDLIQFNKEGNIVMSPESELTITPVYNIDSSYIGTTTITTSVLPL